MIKFFYKFLLIFSLVIIPLTNAWATDARTTRYGLTDAGTYAQNLKQPGAVPSTSLAEEAGRIVGTIVSFWGIIFLVLMIAGGIMWMVAGGNDAKVKTARSLIVAAIVGLIIVLSAYAITTFVADNLLAK